MLSSQAFILLIQLTLKLKFPVDKLRANVDGGLYNGMTLIDLQKAFNIVDYIILTKN